MNNLVKINKHLTYPKCKLTLRSIEFDHSIIYEEWEEIGKHLQSMHGSCGFWIGDWLNFGEQKWGEKYAQAISETGLDYDTLATYVRVCKEIDITRRRVNLSFTAHREIALAPKEKQDGFLEKAEKENLSSHKVRELVKQCKQLNQTNRFIEAKDSKIDIRHDDFRNVVLQENSIDLILTDPPYPKEYLPLWEILGLYAHTVLKPGGFLITYCGHSYLPEIIDYFRQSGLHYHWIMALYHKGPTAQCFHVNFWNRFKPILIFQKPPVAKQKQWLEDVVVSEKPDKEFHEWGQNTEPFEKLIEAFSNIGDTVLDPFMGGGAVIEACGKLKRNVIGIDVDEKCYKLVKSRIKK